MSILAPVRGFNINFNYDPQRAYTDQQGVRHDEPNFTYIPSATKLTGPIANMLILFPLGMYLYTRSPNEQNGNFLLYPKLKTLCMICCVIFYWNVWRNGSGRKSFYRKLLYWFYRDQYDSLPTIISLIKIKIFLA